MRVAPRWQLQAESPYNFSANHVPSIEATSNLNTPLQVNIQFSPQVVQLERTGHVSTTVHMPHFLVSLIDIYLSMALGPFVGCWTLFNCLNLHTVGRMPWTWDRPIARNLTEKTRELKRNKRTRISIQQVGLEPNPSVWADADSPYLNPAATVIGESLTGVY
jgi:hypothetical protein